MSDAESAKTPEALTFSEETPVVTHHTKAGLTYTATAGRMPLKDEKGEIHSQIFYVAYTLDGQDAAKRPLTIVFNGGPGAPAFYLHMGALGPVRAVMTDEGFLPGAPYRWEENPLTWLRDTDLVFVDPVGTGYSRGRDKDTNEKAWSLKGDLESVGEFIRCFLNRANRWNSPLYVCGESYGTTRTAGLSSLLLKNGIGLAGVILVSAVLNFQTLDAEQGNDLPHLLFFPSFAATAWYHGRLSGFSGLEDVLAQAEAFVKGPYNTALMLGDDLEGEERKTVVNEYARLTGLSPEFVDLSDLRVQQPQFCKELMRTERRTVGRLDSRVQGINHRDKGAADRGDHDPSMSMLNAPYMHSLQHYLRAELGYQSDLEYSVFYGIKTPWLWNERGEAGFPDTSESLRFAMAQNPHLRVFVASGFYDLATPYFATEYTVRHMGLDPALRKNVRIEYYNAGHMMYVNRPDLEKLASDVSSFYRSH